MNDRFTPDDTRDLLREIGGLLLGLAAAMIYIRKGPFLAGNPDKWAAFPMFLVLAIPAVYLYGGILSRPQTGRLRPWQLVHSVFGLIFVALTLRQFVDMIGGTPGADLNTFWIFTVTAAIAFYAGFVGGVRVQILVGGIALIVSWSALWDKFLPDSGITAHWGTYRGLLGLLSIGLLAGALYVWRTNPGGDEIADTGAKPAGDLGLWKASELLTAAGIAAVIACSLGITALGNLNPLGTSTPPIQTSDLWDILLLLVSLGLVMIGAQIGTRGPAYVGGIGLTLFLVIAGFDLNSDHPDPTKFGGWPWVLLILGLIALGLSFTREASLGDRPRRFVQDLRGR
jgi:hypothetical protein